MLDAAQMSTVRLFRRGDIWRWSSASRAHSAAPGRGADYSGPFRIEATGVTAQRGLRAPDQSGLRVDLEIAWEPRLRPIALDAGRRRLEGHRATTAARCPPPREDAAFDVEVDAGSHAAEVTHPAAIAGPQR